MTKVACGVIRSEKGYLIAQKKESLLWEFPGGKIQDGETNNQALIREIKEELNLDIEPVFEITRYAFDKYTLIFIYAVSTNDSIELKEHQNTLWIEPNKLIEYEFTSGDTKFVEYLDVKNWEREKIGFEHLEDLLFFENLFDSQVHNTPLENLFDFSQATEKRKSFNKIRNKVFEELKTEFGETCQLGYSCCDLSSGYAVDHFIPLSSNVLNKQLRKLKAKNGKKVESQFFGSNHRSNFLLACNSCNNHKKHRLPKKYIGSKFLNS